METSSSSSSCAPSSMDVHEAQALLAAISEKLGREVIVFQNKAAMSTTSEILSNSTEIEEESEDFYEFTKEDYARVMASKKPDVFLKTKKIRDAEAAAKRASITKAVIRVLFPDNYFLEAKFQASDSLSLLFDLLSKVVSRPDIPFYIYTTPPKQKVQDLTIDFYTAGFTPGAVVHFSYDVSKGLTEEQLKEIMGGPYLKSDVMGICDLHLLVKPPHTDVEKPEQTRVTDSPPDRAREDVASKSRKTGTKPKWMKL